MHFSLSRSPGDTGTRRMPSPACPPRAESPHPLHVPSPHDSPRSWLPAFSVVSRSYAPSLRNDRSSLRTPINVINTFTFQNRPHCHLLSSAAIVEIRIQMCGGCIITTHILCQRRPRVSSLLKYVAVLITSITCVYVAPSWPSHLHEYQSRMQLTIKSEEQPLRAHSSFWKGIRAKLNALPSLGSRLFQKVRGVWGARRGGGGN